MVAVTRLVLDVLKPHVPNPLDFALHMAEQAGCGVEVRVMEVDEKTQSILMTLVGEHLDFDRIQRAITTLGASLHSIDEVFVEPLDPTAG
jgi:hypothetical protein